MDYFNYQSNHLHCEGVAMSQIAEQFDTPCYVYSRATLVEHYTRLAEAFAPLDPLLCYSIKSCSNISICKTLAECGAGMDLVSGGELHRAKLAGVDPAQCVYAGVGKSDAEIRQSLEAGVGWFNIESEAEFENVSAIAKSMNLTCNAALRVNPDVDPKTHRYTTTGKKETKFGVDIERAKSVFERYGKDEHCILCGIHVHLGSPIYSAEPYVTSLRKILILIDELDVRGIKINMLDLGGGFGADYESDQTPLASEYAKEIVPLLQDRASKGMKIILEPGRTITANAGILLLKVLYVKTSGEKTFVTCDGGMNVMMRPSHYGAFHFIWPCSVDAKHIPPRRAKEMDLPDLIMVDVVGPICETGDFLAIDRLIPPVVRGDLIALFGAGAYGMSMSNRYNSMPLPAEVLVDQTTAKLVRRRETYDDLTSHELNL